MKKKSLINIIRVSCIGLLLCAMMIGIFTAPGGKASGYHASYIDLMNDAPKLDLKDYLNSSVMF